LVCLDNLHVLQRQKQAELLHLIGTILQDSVRDGALFLLTSWDKPGLPARVGVEPARGFTDREFRNYLALYDGLRFTDAQVQALCQALSRNIEVLEIFVRSARSGRLEVDDFLRHPAESLRGYLWTKYLAEISDPERQVLLAFAVLREPATREFAEAVSETAEFPLVFKKLLDSPPLLDAIEDDSGKPGRFDLHTLVRHAVLDASSRPEKLARHEAAARAFEARNDFLRGAEQWRQALRHQAAVDLLTSHTEEVLGRGEHDLLGRLLEELDAGVKGNQDLIGKLHAIKGNCMQIRGEFPGAIRLYGFALAETADPSRQLRLLNRMGDCHRLQSAYDEAQRIYQEVIDRARGAASLQAKAEYAAALLGSAKMHRLACRYADALAAYGQALDHFERIGDHRGMMWTYFGFGEVRRLQRRYDESRKYYREALGESKKDPEKEDVEGQAYAAWGIGEVDRFQGRLDEAKEMHQHGLLLCEQLRDRRSEGWAHLGLAEVARMTGDWEPAERRYGHSQRLFEDTGSWTEIAHARLGMAELRRCQGRPELDGYEEAEKIYRPRNLQHCLVLSLLGKSLAMRALWENEASIQDALEEAEDICVRCGLDPELATVQKLRAGRSSDGDIDNPLNFP
jgi:tetratricopeptide (TPR) repeat protein